MARIINSFFFCLKKKSDFDEVFKPVSNLSFWWHPPRDTSLFPLPVRNPDTFPLSSLSHAFCPTAIIAALLCLLVMLISSALWTEDAACTVSAVVAAATARCPRINVVFAISNRSCAILFLPIKHKLCIKAVAGCLSHWSGDRKVVTDMIYTGWPQGGGAPSVMSDRCDAQWLIIAQLYMERRVDYIISP